jgi:hypothetical protein
MIAAEDPGGTKFIGIYGIQMPSGGIIHVFEGCHICKPHHFKLEHKKY